MRKGIINRCGRCCLLAVPDLAHAKTYTQHGNAASYNVNKYKMLRTRTCSLSVTRSSKVTDIFQTTPTSISSIKGKKVIRPTSSYPLLTTIPLTAAPKVKYCLRMATPVRTDHHEFTEYAWLDYPRRNLEACGVNLHQHEPHGRPASRHYDHSVKQMTSTDEAIMKYIRLDMFNTGHGQSLAMNPKNGQLWFIAPVKVHSNVQQVSLAR